MTAIRRWGAAPSVLALLAVVCVVTDAPQPLRGTVVVAFCLVGPGAPIVPRLGLDHPVESIGVAVGVSFALVVVVAQALLAVGHWSPELALGVLCAWTWLTALPLVLSRLSGAHPGEGG